RNPGLGMLFCLSLAGSVLAGAVCAGTGTGAATPLVADAVTESATTAPPPVPVKPMWSLKNDTTLPIYGTWGEQEGDKSSGVDRPAWRAWASNEVVYAEVTDGGSFDKTRWWGHVCYDHTWRNLNGFWFPKEAIVQLFRETDGGLWASFDGAGEFWGYQAVRLIDNVAEGSC
ncbi:hypothetical protein, partial [Rhodococcus jostii]|uniref:hypothetical protein n=1 Tax=Rhodococcus jostii TaxID=132919 RepID=UPI003631871C